MTQFLQHNRIRLALHTLKPGDGLALLLLHGLGERSPARLPDEYARWRGPVHALDFTGHGASQIPRGGGYTCELLMADADAALAHLGRATVAGRGLGGYVALLLSGARPQRVHGAILRDGPGLAGGGTNTKQPYIPVVDTGQPAPPDPYALADLATDARPPGYAAHYATLANLNSPLSRPIAICTREQPEWLSAVMALGIERVELADALDEYAAEAP
ncbi:alpha/beta hydrolase [Verticiella sediminum]|uniref:Alpha/beta hydrolase n=1 Tax=Verticiella sediminum TaxID=1247510 RepID=A0A556AGT4_9BURK|nr:alpha/beta hydrolase [Verticiella sediminum]TSH92097.1 alpha/beta hydrolase [Verticiella sediminum]